jgi:hypothetical protein
MRQTSSTRHGQGRIASVVDHRGEPLGRKEEHRLLRPVHLEQDLSEPNQYGLEDFSVPFSLLHGIPLRIQKNSAENSNRYALYRYALYSAEFR